MLALQKYLEGQLITLNDWLNQDEIEGYRWYDHNLVEFSFSVDVYLDFLHIHLSKDDDDTEQFQKNLKQFFLKIK